jgi:hypothetical protein
VEVRTAAEVLEAAAGGPTGALLGEVLGLAPGEPLLIGLGTVPEALGTAPLGGLPSVVVGIGDEAAPAAALADVVVEDESAAATVLAAVDENPLAATALVLLLRGAAARDVADGLAAESSTYSMLQAGPEHHGWLDEHRRRPRADGGHRVEVRRDGTKVVITLDRPAARNAVDAAMQAALVDAFASASDPAVSEVELRGAGPVFSSGGDLGEFGSLDDPASAHLVRLGRSPAAALHRIAERTTAYVQGACHGAGVELPAFAVRVIADPAATFTLPEIAMGLIPGAGGTVSITKRIGRHRTAWLAITGKALDAETALDWGLVDELARVR